jgi:hypothetical protein
MVPSFAETYEALETEFFYAHSVTDADRERILGLEVIFSIEEKFCHDAKDNILFTLKKKWFLGFFVLAHISFIFSVPFKTEKSRVHCIYIYRPIVNSFPGTTIDPFVILGFKFHLPRTEVFQN